MIREEFNRFKETLNGTHTSDSVRKIANIVSSQFDNLIPLTTHQGSRIKKIVQLSRAHWETVPTKIILNQEKISTKVAQLSRLKSMTVGPFRGFSRQEIFDLDSRIVLAYGPNGTGKSSFCEALEYALLGSVAEAESKRFREQTDYLKNAFVNELAPTDLMAVDDLGNDIAINANESVFRFCFVEKNRIDSFSRIAAQAPARQTQLIATLFGLESFNEFVRNFTPEIGEQYIDLHGIKTIQLKQKQQSLQIAHQQIQKSNTELERITSDGIRLAVTYRDGATFEQMVFELTGDGISQGLIQQLDSELQQPPPPKANLISAMLKILENDTTALVSELRQKQHQLAEASQQVSFKHLYEAVTEVQLSSPEACPACKTPLQNVVVNPYDHAGNELSKLQKLAELQQNIIQLTQYTKQKMFTISQYLSTCLKFYPNNNPLQALQTNDIQPDLKLWDALLSKRPDNNTAWQLLVSQVQQLEENDKNIDEALRVRKHKQDKLNKLRDVERQVTILKTQKQTAQSAIAVAQSDIDNFEKENAQLIIKVEAEKVVVAKNHEIVRAYATFVRKLTNYSNGLPALLIADLGELVVELYNAFNRNDQPNELLASVKLPLSQNQHLEISFQNQPGKFYDALHILSEGHIRCLGLAILLAKNHREQAPFLIFDDPVNAIDDDHRESIRRTLFEDDYFATKQILLTCNGEEFFKDIQNLLSVNDVQNSKILSFLPRLGEQHIRVDFHCAPRNYILAACNHIGRNEVREALSKSRQALEALTRDKIWKYVHRHGDGNLSIKMRSSTESIGLRQLTEQLNSKIKKPEFTDPNKSRIYDPINNLLGINGESREWRYLNKGTHEENGRAEFDRGSVSAIVAALVSIDEALQ
jgi:energy-coupling factor transporter ATP-binding protein EcfA2